MTVRLAAAFGIAMLASTASAQVPPDIAEKIRADGQAMDPIASSALYAPLFANETYAGITLTRDIGYGADPLQVLDLYVPNVANGPLPVLLFIHGGGFTRGDKHGSYYPDNITAWAARHGMVGVNVNYRLAPGTMYPGAAQDLAASIAWVRANIAQHGGDPDRIMLFGHSAGANHVIDYLGHRELHGEEMQGVKGAVLLSPNYVFGEPHVYYGSDAQAASAAAARLRAAGVPLFVAYAQFDPDSMRRTTETLIADLCSLRETCPTSVELADHNHYTEGNAVATSDVSLTAPLLEWLQTLR